MKFGDPGWLVIATCISSLLLYNRLPTSFNGLRKTKHYLTVSLSQDFRSYLGGSRGCSEDASQDDSLPWLLVGASVPHWLLAEGLSPLPSGFLPRAD